YRSEVHRPAGKSERQAGEHCEGYEVGGLIITDFSLLQISGSVLGIDIGYFKTERSSAVCRFDLRPLQIFRQNGHAAIVKPVDRKTVLRDIKPNRANHIDGGWLPCWITKQNHHGAGDVRHITGIPGFSFWQWRTNSSTSCSCLGVGEIAQRISSGFFGTGKIEFALI
ncbi:MAG: hypothetical protein WB821_15835, partial [Burkholderiaceae bacterium]